MIRPLLDVGRPELRKYLADRGQTYQEDETNRDLSVTRNRVRHELIPFLEERFSPSVVDTLARDAKIARHDAEWLDAAANRSASTIVTYEDGSSWLHVESLTGQPVALARRIAKRALEHVTGHTAGFAQVERVLALASGEATSGEVDLPGCRVRRSRDRVYVGPPLSRTMRPTASEGFCLSATGSWGGVDSRGRCNRVGSASGGRGCRGPSDCSKRTRLCRGRAPDRLAYRQELASR